VCPPRRHAVDVYGQTLYTSTASDQHYSRRLLFSKKSEPVHTNTDRKVWHCHRCLCCLCESKFRLDNAKRSRWKGFGLTHILRARLDPAPMVSTRSASQRAFETTTALTKSFARLWCYPHFVSTTRPGPRALHTLSPSESF
jgi:hypothetical protein